MMSFRLELLCALLGTILLELLTHTRIDYRMYLRHIQQCKNGAAWMPGSNSPSLSRYYRTIQEQEDREHRFPSIDERIRFYMGTWYVPPCPGNTEAMVAFHKVGNTTYVQEIAKQNARTWYLPGHQSEIGRVFTVNPETIGNKCDRKYCHDTMEFLVPAVKRLNEEASPEDLRKPLAVIYSDAQDTRGYLDETMTKVVPNLEIPVFKKFRISHGGLSNILEATDAECIKENRPFPPTEVDTGRRHQHIITRMASLRHYDPLKLISTFDVPWDQKQDLATFRGSLTGLVNHPELHYSDKFDKLTNVNKCQALPRCRLVYNTAESKLVDAKLVYLNGLVPSTIRGKNLVGDEMSYEKALSYKAIIMIEGNDVSTGLKWALNSNSVVLTQKPTKSSWLMEELLQPWVHYVPLNEELTDVNDKMQWVLEHQVEAQEIAHRASLWIRDLLFHPAAERDDEIIHEEMIRRYRNHFYEDTTLQLRAPEK